MLTQFVAAFDDIVIKRFNVNRKIEDKISVRYVYSPKQRVLYDIVNTAQNITLPAVAVTIGGITRDNNRVFNKLDGFTYSEGSNKKSARMRSPVPINITINMSIITRFQTDMDQILSNFIPYSNPYVIISWPIPTEFGLPSEQEIRSEVLWDGTMNMNYPVDLNGQEKARIIADTTFTIKGWLFKETSNPVNNIYYIKDNFYVESLITNYYELSGQTTSYPLSTGLYTETEFFEISASPTISNFFFDTVLMNKDIALTPGLTGSVILEGSRYNLLDGILLSTNNETLFSSITSVNIQGKYPQIITGQLLEDFIVINENIIAFNLPPLYPNFRYPNAKLCIVPFNKAGFTTSANTYTVNDAPISTLFYYGNL